MKISCQEGLVPGKRFAEKWEFLEKVGFDGIELNGELEDLDERKKEIKRISSGSKVKTSTICGSARGCLLASGKRDRNVAMTDIKRLLELASELEANGLIYAPLVGIIMGWSQSQRIPDLSPFYSRQELEKGLLIELLREIADFAEQIGSILFLEPVNRFQTLWPTTVQETLGICESVNSNNIKVVIDLFHMNIEEKDPMQSIIIAKNHVGHVHICDSNRRLPNKGHINFKRVIETLKEIHYDDYLALECEIDDESAEKELPKCLEFLRKLL